MWPLWGIILESVFTVLILLGNGMVIYLIAMKRNLRTRNNWIALSLAIADFGVGATFAPPYIFCNTHNNCAPRAKGIVILTGNCFLYASLTNLSVLALERYKAIVTPLRYVMHMTSKRVALLLSIAWGVPGVIWVCYVAAYLSAPAQTYRDVKKTFWRILAMLAFFVSAILLFATVKIFLVARKISRQNAAVITQLGFNHEIKSCSSFRSRETASARLVGILVAAFVACYCLHIFDTMSRVFLSSPLKMLNIIFTLLALVNSGLNPVAYALLRREFRNELKRTLFGEKRRLIPPRIRETRIHPWQTPQTLCSLTSGTQHWYGDTSFLIVHQTKGRCVRPTCA